MDVRDRSEQWISNGWPLLLPLAFLLHLAEETWAGGGLPHWAGQALGRPISEERFLIINAVAWPIFAALTAAAIKKPALRWFLTSFSALLVLNAVLHALGTLVTASYSPGLVTGLLIYLPLGGQVLNATNRLLPANVFTHAVLGGIVLHAAVALVAFS